MFSIRTVQPSRGIINAASSLCSNILPHFTNGGSLPPKYDSGTLTSTGPTTPVPPRRQFTVSTARCIAGTAKLNRNLQRLQCVRCPVFPSPTISGFSAWSFTTAPSPRSEHRQIRGNPHNVHVHGARQSLAQLHFKNPRPTTSDGHGHTCP